MFSPLSFPLPSRVADGPTNGLLILGARAYFVHRVLHDWPDAQARQILGRIRVAMVPGYSRLLLSEFVITEREPYAQTTSLDLVMLVVLGAQERTEGMWRDLLESEGLRLVKIWRSEVTPEHVIEAVVA